MFHTAKIAAVGPDALSPGQMQAALRAAHHILRDRTVFRREIPAKRTQYQIDRRHYSEQENQATHNPNLRIGTLPTATIRDSPDASDSQNLSGRRSLITGQNCRNNIRKGKDGKCVYLAEHLPRFFCPKGSDSRQGARRTTSSPERTRKVANPRFRLDSPKTCRCWPLSKSHILPNRRS